MREIKFRAWNPIRKEMMPWEFVKTQPLEKFALPDSLTPTMQYTGLKDRSGKEIYEGDIVNVENQGSKPYIVEYVPCLSSFRLSEKGAQHTQSCEDHMLWSHGLYGSLSVVVIGNIYENPDLSTRSNA